MRGTITPKKLAARMMKMDPIRRPSWPLKSLPTAHSRLTRSTTSREIWVEFIFVQKKDLKNFLKNLDVKICSPNKVI